MANITGGSGISFAFAPKNNFIGSVAPEITDDESKGYSKGSRWIAIQTHWVCLDAASGAALWTATENITPTLDAEFDNLILNNDLSVGNDATINGELTVQGLGILHHLIHASVTGIHNGGVLSINTDTAKFDITAGDGQVIDNFTAPDAATLTDVVWAAFTAVVVTGLATQDRTYIAIDSNGDIVQQATPYSPDQFRDHIFIGLINHANRTAIELVFPLSVLGHDTGAQLQDVILAIGIINTSGNVFTAASTDLTLARSAGEVFRQGSNYDGTASGRKNPNFSSSASSSPVNFRYRYQDGSGGWTESASNITSITPALYDDGDGVLGTVSNNKWSIQRIYYIDDSAPTTRILYGQLVYSSLSIAEAALAGEAVNIDPDLISNFSLRGWLLVKGGATDLSDTATAKFISADKFGLTVSGGGTTATTDLQTAYNNSIDPEILLTTAQGGFSIADANTPLGAVLFEVQDFARSTSYLSVDSSGATVAGNITVTGTVDSRDIATDGSNQDTHIADSTLHFTEGSVDHGSISGLADDDHTQYFNQTRLNDGTITALTVDNITLNGNSLNTLAGNLVITPAGGGVFIDGSITGVNVVSANTLLGTIGTAIQTNITSLGTLTTLTVDNVTINGDLVDGRDVAADGTKLDTIETSATADQTAGEIEAIVSHDNLVDFTTTEHFTQGNITTVGTVTTGTISGGDSTG